VDEAPSLGVDEDVVLLLQACNAAFNDRVLGDVRRAAGDDVRFNDGYVFQHLVPGPVSVTELARRLGVSQQAASQQVADLQTRGLVVRRADPDDARARLVELSDRGRRAVEAGRRSREAVNDELVELLGRSGRDDLLDALTRVSDATGALAALAGRRLRPDEDR
jgi:DNA-binding MarR family transcriptional regulator